MKFTSMLIVAMIGISTTAFSQSANMSRDDRTQTPVIHRHQLDQRARIRQGVRSGELTRAEAARLRSEQRMIRRQVQTAKAYGTVTRVERARLRHEQREGSEHIYRLKHNSSERPGL